MDKQTDIDRDRDIDRQRQRLRQSENHFRTHLKGIILPCRQEGKKPYIKKERVIFR